MNDSVTFRVLMWGKSRETMQKAISCLLGFLSPLGVIDDKRQFVKSVPGSVRCIFSGRMLKLHTTTCTMIKINVQRSFSF